jgi:hypothetical protein
LQDIDEHWSRETCSATLQRIDSRFHDPQGFLIERRVFQGFHHTLSGIWVAAPGHHTGHFHESHQCLPEMSGFPAAQRNSYPISFNGEGIPLLSLRSE